MKSSVKYFKMLCNLLSFIVVILCVIFVLPKIIFFFMPFVIGFILSLIANPLVRFLEKKIKIKRKYGTVLMIMLVILGIVLACYGTGLLFMNGIHGFMAYLPTMYENAELELNTASAQLEALLHKIPAFAKLDFAELSSMVLDEANILISSYKEPTFSAIGGIAKSIPDMFVKSIMGLLATYFFIADRDKITAAVERHLPDAVKEKIRMVYMHILHAVGGYFKAQFKIMFVVYVVITAGLMILRVDYAWLIGFGIAFLDMLPVFGTGTVLIPWAAVKIFSGNITMAAGMIILYVVALVVHQLIQPKLVGESVGLDPFAALFFMYIGYEVKGVIGMIIAIPAGMILYSLFEAGAFEYQIWCIKEAAGDFRKFCRIDRNQKKKIK